MKKIISILVLIFLYFQLLSSAENIDFTNFYDALGAGREIPSKDFWAGLEKISGDEEILDIAKCTYIKRAKGGTSGTRIYEDLEGIKWYVKTAQHSDGEYLGSRLMRLILGENVIPLVKLVNSKETASRELEGFCEGELSEGVEGVILRDLAMALIGVGDMNSGNGGHVYKDGRKYSARVDFDHSFYYTGKFLSTGIKQGDFHLDISQFMPPIKKSLWKGELNELIEASEHLLALPSRDLEKIFFRGVMVLYAMNKELDWEKYIKIINGILERRNLLQDIKDKLIALKDFLDKPSLENYNKLEENAQSGYYGGMLLQTIMVKAWKDISKVEWAFENGVIKKEQLRNLLLERRSLNRENIQYFLEKGVILGAEFVENAALAGDKETVIALIGEGTNITDAENLLEYAIVHFDCETLKFLLECGAKSSSRLLLIAAQGRGREITEFLLDELFEFGRKALGQHVTFKMHELLSGGRYPDYVLETAIEQGDVDLVEKILFEGNLINSQLEKLFLRVLQGCKTTTDLVKQHAMYAILKKFVYACKVNINVSDEDGQTALDTALHIASRHDDRPFIEILLDRAENNLE